MSALLLHGGPIATSLTPTEAMGDPLSLVLEDGAIRIGADGRIEALGPASEIAPPAVRDAFPGEVVDLGGALVLPGQINAHTHLYSTLACGMPPLPGEPPADFREVLERVWWPLDRALNDEDVYLSALFGLLDCARAGVTTVIDHHASEGAVAGSLDAVARAAAEVGLRVCTAFEVTDRDGPEVARAGLDENVRFAAAVRAAPHPLGGVASRAASLGLHASLTLGGETLRRARAALEEHGLPGAHVHVAEDRADPADALARDGVRTVVRLHRAGLLGPGTIAAHAIWVDDEEVALLAETGTFVVLNPSSNMNNGVGRADLARLRAGGVRLAAGSDGMTPDVLGEVRQAYLVRRDAAGDPRVGFDDAVALLTGNRALADVFFPGAALGTLRPGGPADLAILDYDPWTPVTGDNLLGHVLYGRLGSRVRSVLCGGRFVLRDGRFPLLEARHDPAALAARAREAACALWSRRQA